MRPPKKIDSRAHKSAGSSRGRRLFRKGRYGSPGPAEFDTDEAGYDDAESLTYNAAFPSEDPKQQFSSQQEKVLRSSKYTARATTAPAPISADAFRKDVVVDLTADMTEKRKVVIDFTKLPPSDESRRSDSFYVRHSENWPG